MNDRIRRLDWDSDFFGFPIGRIDLDGAGRTDIEAAEASARADGLRCLYAALDPTADGPRTVELQRLGYRFVDAATLFELRTSEPAIDRPDGTEFRLGTPDDVEEVAGIVELMAAWSRYAVDEGFGIDAARRLQSAWLARAVDPAAQNHSLMVATQDGEIIAFIGRVREPHPRVDAVGTTRRGSGAARYLIETARGWAGDRPLLGGPIAARNVPSLRYVSHCNYRVCRVEYLFHRWLDEDPT